MATDTEQNESNGLPPTSRSLAILLIRARETVMVPIRKMLSEAGITEQQWRVLRVLSECGPMDSSKVADRASLLHSSMTRIAYGMREKELITQVQDANDRRRQKIAITPKGQAIIDSNVEQVIAISETLKDRLGADRVDQLVELLQALAEDETETEQEQSR